MRVGLVIPNTWEHATDSVVRLGALAEETGVDSVWVTDHVVGARSFRPVYGPVWLEALTCLAFLAGATSRIRLGTSVLVVPYRDPVYTAKVIATLDQLSGGRVDLGVGVGWSQAEYHALGRGHLFERRGAATNEALDVMLRCWNGGELQFDGEFSRFRSVEFAPVPVQRPHPPLWVGGGDSPPTRRRVARYADVWHPAGLSPDEVTDRGDRIDELAGRHVPRGPRLVVDPSDVDRLPDLLAGYGASRCTDVVIEFRHPTGPTPLDEVERCVERLAGRRRATGD